MSQTQPNQLYLGLPNLAEEGRKKRAVIALFDVMAHLATAHEETPSMLDDVDNDMTELEHVSKSITLGSEGEGLPQGSPKRVDPVAKSTTKHPMGRQGVWHPSCKKTLKEVVPKS